MQTCICGNSSHFQKKMLYLSKPVGETDFGITQYNRLLWKCMVCNHFLSEHKMAFGNDIYSGTYMKTKYPEGIWKEFERVKNLSEEQSNNRGRIKRVCRFRIPGKLLDIGSGICVFPDAMRSRGWDCTVYDIDKNVIDHAKFLSLKILAGLNSGHRNYDLVSFTNVLEHASNPISMLATAKKFLVPEGIVYIEVPDGEEAAKDGFLREEFFIEHWHIFSMASVALLAKKAGFIVNEMERLKEPSGIYTIRAFLRP